MRRVQPYVAVGAQVTGAPLQPSVVTSAPVLDTRRRYGTNSMEGLYFQGSKNIYEPVESPWAGQGLVSPVFPLTQPSKASGVTIVGSAPQQIQGHNDIVGTAKFWTANFMSPMGHRNVIEEMLPEPAALPVTKFTNQNLTKRGTFGNFTIPSPVNVSYWPTTQQWLENRGMVR
jgi:hypothetical protein